MRLIDADALKDVISDTWVLDRIDKQPTVDAEPARHGKWKRSKFYKSIIFCDECGEPFELSNSMEHWNYCPNCGIRMDGEDDEN